MGVNTEQELPLTRDVRKILRTPPVPLGARVFSDCSFTDLVTPGPEEEVAHNLAVKQLDTAIVNAVTPKQLMALRYHIEKALPPTSQVTGLTLSRLAEEMDISKEEVRTLSYRGIRNVKKLLNSHPELLHDL